MVGKSGWSVTGILTRSKQKMQVIRKSLRSPLVTVLQGSARIADVVATAGMICCGHKLRDIGTTRTC